MSVSSFSISCLHVTIRVSMSFSFIHLNTFIMLFLKFDNILFHFGMSDHLFTDSSICSRFCFNLIKYFCVIDKALSDILRFLFVELVYACLDLKEVNII